MITIKNSQKKIVIDSKRCSHIAQTMLDQLNYSDFDLGIWFTTNQTIQKFNKKYRGKDKPTDILSFSYHDSLKPGERIKPETEEDKNLGDLIISLEQAKKDAMTKWNQPFEKHIIMLFAHGIAHLIGYDHETDAEYAQMSLVEKKLLTATKDLKL